VELLKLGAELLDLLRRESLERVRGGDRRPHTLGAGHNRTAMIAGMGDGRHRYD
jgi:hypothetical protein